MTPREPFIDGFDFSDDRVAVVVEPDEGCLHAPRWMVWHVHPDDGPDGWVRRDWLQEVEQGFQFGDEMAFEGLNIWHLPDGRIVFERPPDAFDPLLGEAVGF